MLKARKNFLFEKFFIRYNRGLLKRRFASIQVSGLKFIEDINPDVPLIFCANHSSWWDGLVVLETVSNFKFDFYVMMEEKQLHRLQFFRLLGAFSIVRTNPREALQSIDYSAKILSEKKNRIVLIFPQGKILHNDIRPLKFYNGLAKVCEKTGVCQVCPMAIRYEFTGEFKPEIFISFGKPLIFDSAVKTVRKKITCQLENVTTSLLDALKQQIIKGNFEDFRKIL